MFILKSKNKRVVKALEASEQKLLNQINCKDRELDFLYETITELESFDTDELIEHTINKIVNGGN